MTRRQGTPEERFWPKVDKTDPSGCWIWTASRTADGYGRFRVDQSTVKSAHRFAWELLIGPIAPGLVLDHLCRTPPCVNPAHLRDVTDAENIMAPGSLAPAKANAEKTHCKHGHAFTAENTYLSRSGGRYCRSCHRIKNRLARLDASVVEGGLPCEVCGRTYATRRGLRSHLSHRHGLGVRDAIRHQLETGHVDIEAVQAQFDITRDQVISELAVLRRAS